MDESVRLEYIGLGILAGGAGYVLVERMLNYVLWANLLIALIIAFVAVAIAQRSGPN